MTVMTSRKQSSTIDTALTDRALQALLKHHRATTNEQKSLLGDDRVIQVQFSLERVPENPSPKPIRILIPHPLYKIDQDDDGSGLEEPSVCLIVKEESKKWVQEMIQNFPKEMGFVKKVLGLQSLRKKHARFEQRRQLLSRFDVFMADDRILPMLAKALGKDFFRTKKHPIPISLTRKTALPFNILQSLQATFLYISSGTTLTIRAGTTSMPPQHVLENIAAVVENAVPKIPRKWSNIRSIAIKTPTSMSLPFYNKTPEELQQIAEMAGLAQEVLAEEAAVEKTVKKEAKRKLAAKSPLVQALKKQLESEKEVQAKGKKSDVADERASSANEPKKETAHEPKKETAKKKKRKTSVEVEDSEVVEFKVSKKVEVADKRVGSTKEPKKETAHEHEPKKESAKKKKRKMSVEVEDSEVVEFKVSKKVDVADKRVGSAKETKKETAHEPKKESAKKKKRKMSVEAEDSEVVEFKVSKKVSKKSATNSEAVTDKEVKITAKGEFMASKKFKGSVKGYVFRNGKEGVGYYIDVKPVVDRIAMEAFKRLSSSQSRGGGRKSSKSQKGRRGRR